MLKGEVPDDRAERRELGAWPRIELVTVPQTGHFTLNTHPREVAEFVSSALAGR